MRLRRGWLVGLVILLAPAGCASEPKPIGKAATTVTPTQSRSVFVDGQWRTFRLHVPPDTEAGPSHPLVLALHGKGSSAEELEESTRLSEAAESRGVIVAYLEGLHQGWGLNTGPTDLRPDPEADIAFTGAVINELSGERAIDRQRVYAAGFSGGGSMAVRLAAQRPDWFAGAATVSGQLPAWPDDVEPKGPIPVLSIYGDADPVRPITGVAAGEGEGPHITDEPAVNTLSTEETVRRFAMVDDANDRQDEDLPPMAADDGTSVSRQTWSHPDSGQQVISYTVHGGGHVWPSSIGANPALVGPVSQQLDGTGTILDFFAAH